MATDDGNPILSNDPVLHLNVEGVKLDAGGYRYHIAVSKDDQGVFSVIILNLPGAGSCGASEDEAIENAKEAALGVIESYVEDGEEIPWTDSYEIPQGAKTRWISVNG